MSERWLREHAVPLATCEPGAPLDDLGPLAEIVGDARVVSLGEATHGTREFFLLKHRIVELCVERLGFSSFGIEASYPDALPLSRWVAGGDGDPLDGLGAMRFWVWNTQEVLGLVRWLRERRVTFNGFDMQSPSSSARLVGGFPELATDFNVSMYRRLPSDVRASVRERCAALDEGLTARTLAQGLDLHGGQPEQMWAVRDRAMAENVVALLGQHGPIVTWAHNGHAQRVAWKPDVEAMGGHLDRLAGQVVVGFAFGSGSFQAMDKATGELRDFAVPMAPDGTLDAALASVEHPVFMIDLRDAPELPFGTRSIASVYSDDPDVVRSIYGSELASCDARACFDVLVFVRTTTAARRNVAIPAAGAATLGGWSLQTGRPPAAYTFEADGDAIAIARPDVPWAWGDGVARRTVEHEAGPFRFEATVEVDGPGQAQLFAASGDTADWMWDRPVTAANPGRAAVEIDATGPVTIGLVMSGSGRATFGDLRWSPSDA